MKHRPNSIQDKVRLNNGVEMPWLGLGVFMIEDFADLSYAINAAFESGYRSIDTAAIYGNEAGVGQAIRASGLDRQELFITSKLWNEPQTQGFDACLQACESTLDRLGLDTLDLYLIHWPQKGFIVEAWRALVKLMNDGKVRAIGVSNFSAGQIDELIEATGIVPAVNQVELQPWNTQKGLLDDCRSKGIQVEAYCPLMRGRFHEIPELAAIAARYKKTIAQVILRWDLHNGVIVIPKSTHARRIAENADIFDFELAAEDLKAIDDLNRDQTVLPPPPPDLH